MNDFGGPIRGLGVAHGGQGVPHERQGVAHERQGCLIEGKGWPMGWQENLIGHWGYLMKCWKWPLGQGSGQL